MKIYISIPITGLPLEQQRHRADLIKSRLSREGHKVVTPFDVFAGKNPTYADYICSNLRAMADCDAVFFCKGWNMSCGCQIEMETAKLLKRYGKGITKIMYES